MERFHELRALGVKIALDDFGTGYSSLSYLHSLPLDTLKIAKPFIDGLTSGRREASFVGMIVDLARTLELEVIAEGIETADAARRAARAQGRPRPGLLPRPPERGRPAPRAPRAARATTASRGGSRASRPAAARGARAAPSQRRLDALVGERVIAQTTSRPATQVMAEARCDVVA